MAIIGALHTGYTVRDMAASLDFYCGLLGFRLISERPEITAQFFRDIVGMPHAVVHAVLLEIPGTAHTLELFEYKHPEGAAQTLTPTCNPGSAHLCNRWTT